MKTQRHLLKTFLTFFLIMSATMLNAQESKLITISDPGELYSTYNFTTADQEQIIKAYGQARFDAINNASHESQWPSGIAQLSSRTDRREQMMLYKVKVIAVLGEKSLIEIDPANNKHMPADMVAAKPFYFVIGNSGIGEKPQEQEITEEYMEEFFPQVSIDDPGQILSGYKFSAGDIQAIKDQVGEDGYEYINSHCRENSFPKAMNTLSGRLNSREQIKEFNAFLVAECNDFSIIEITPEENAHMPEGLVPADTFYLVIKTAGISILD